MRFKCRKCHMGFDSRLGLERHKCRPHRKWGYTLAEVLVALLVSGFVALVPLCCVWLVKYL